MHIVITLIYCGNIMIKNAIFVNIMIFFFIRNNKFKFHTQIHCEVQKVYSDFYCDFRFLIQEIFFKISNILTTFIDIELLFFRQLHELCFTELLFYSSIFFQTYFYTILCNKDFSSQEFYIKQKKLQTDGVISILHGWEHFTIYHISIFLQHGISSIFFLICSQYVYVTIIKLAVFTVLISVIYLQE